MKVGGSSQPANCLPEKPARDYGLLALGWLGESFSANKLRCMDARPKDVFGTFARIEMFTWAMLITAIIARATIGVDGNVFFIAGATHGFAFIGYSVTAVLVAVNQRWAIGRTILAVVLAIVPFATYPFDRHLEKNKLMDGEWRIEGTKDPRDNTWFDKTFRWFIFRPILLILLLIVFVVSLFMFLIWVGPPYEWGR